jgi:hypothetical protein
MKQADIHVRINQRLNDYWETIRGQRAMPDESDVTPQDIADIWPNCFLVHVGSDGYQYDYLGEAILDAYGDDLRGRPICEALIYPHPPQLLDSFTKVSESGVPCTTEEIFTNAQGVEIKYRSCVLPLTHKHQKHVAFLLGGMKWKASSSRKL